MFISDFRAASTTQQKTNPHHKQLLELVKHIS